MADSNLNQGLNDLSKELNHAEPTEKSQPTIQDLKTQIQPLVEQPDADHSTQYQSLGERLNLALVDLDVDHPRLSAAIQTVLDELAAVGI